MKFFKPKKIIFREEGQALLHRWNIFECRYFSIKIHKLIGSDNACHHDHPWAFLTFLMKGGYVEYTPSDGQKFGKYTEHRHYHEGKAQLVPEIGRVRSRFSLLYRPAYFAHRLEIHQPVWTLVITFRKVKRWGFFTQKGWVFWKEYTRQNNCE
jgi:hypothetical protein